MSITVLESSMKHSKLDKQAQKGRVGLKPQIVAVFFTPFGCAQCRRRRFSLCRPVSKKSENHLILQALDGNQSKDSDKTKIPKHAPVVMPIPPKIVCGCQI